MLAFWVPWSLWWLFLVVAGILIVTIFTRQCLLYAPFHYSTVKGPPTPMGPKAPKKK